MLTSIYIVVRSVKIVLMRVFTYFVSTVVLDVFIACFCFGDDSCGNEDAQAY